MVKRFLFVFATLVGLCLTLGAQSILCLDKTGMLGFKRIKYYINDEIVFKTDTAKRRQKEKIAGFTDSLIYFESKRTINIRDIKIIYRDNSNFVTRGLSKFLIVFGPGFIGLDTFNNLINNRKPVLNDQALIEGAISTAAGATMKIMFKRRYRIGKSKSLKIINLSPN